MKDWTEVSISKLTYQDSSNFATKSHDADGYPLDLLVNTIGNYSGTVTLNFNDHRAPRGYELRPGYDSKEFKVGS